MLATTPAEKRELAKKLEKENPEILEFLKAAAQTFGPLEAVDYKRNDK